MSDVPELEDYIRTELPKLVQVVTGSRVRELELDDGERRLVIRRVQPVEGEAVVLEDSGPNTGTQVLLDSGRNVKVVSSAMVGVFFHSEQPGRAPLVSPGSHVEPGTLLGVIEALQVMTEVEADVHGVVQHVFAADGEPVEYGQPLVEVLLDG